MSKHTIICIYKESEKKGNMSLVGERYENQPKEVSTRWGRTELPNIVVSHRPHSLFTDRLMRTAQKNSKS